MNGAVRDIAQHGSRPDVAERLRAVGVLMVTCSPEGELIARPCAGSDWLGDLLCSSPLIRQGLRQAAATWSEENPPGPFPIMTGVWALPAPLLRRRRVTGYAVALTPTEELLHMEQFHLLCHAAKLDETICRSLVEELPPSRRGEIARLHALVNYVHHDRERLAEQTSTIESMGRQLTDSYEEINLLYTTIQSMRVGYEPRQFLAASCRELLATMQYGWIGVQLATDDGGLRDLRGELITAGELSDPAAIRPLTASLQHKVEADAPLVLEPGGNPAHAAYAPLGETVLVHPITRNCGLLGLLIAGDKQGPDTAVSSIDMKLLSATASHVGIFLENATLYLDLDAMFLGTLEALTAAIDAKDRYTHGHSQRVAHLSRQLALALGLDEATVKRVRIAGLVHDVGKIGVPERVLGKAGRLTDEEFGWIKKHPEIGHRILRDIPQLQDVLPGVLHHHERWDGDGYPHGLVGEKIPLFARILALADSFDAMSSNRTYRRARDRGWVLKEIRRCAGKQFDPDFAPVFVGLDFSEYDRLVGEHSAVEKSIVSVRGEAA